MLLMPTFSLRIAPPCLTAQLQRNTNASLPLGPYGPALNFGMTFEPRYIFGAEELDQ